MTLLTRRVIMIMNFKCRETEKIFHREFSLKLPLEIQDRATQRLLLLDGAHAIKDLNAFRSNRVELLQGYKCGRYSIRINKQWRICFNWQNGNAYEVEIIDYH